MASPGRDESDSQWMDNYRIAAQIGSGKYSDVFMVFTQDAEAYAMKIMKVIPEKGDGPAVDLTGIPHVLQEIRPDKNSPSLYLSLLRSAFFAAVPMHRSVSCAFQSSFSM